MNQKSNAVVTIDLKLHYKFDLVKVLKWLVPIALALVKLLSHSQIASP